MKQFTVAQIQVQTLNTEDVMTDISNPDFGGGNNNQLPVG